jgi:hypothetical protein
MVNKWRKQPEYQQEFFRLLDQQYWPGLKREITSELEAEMRQLHTLPRRNKNSGV